MAGLERSALASVDCHRQRIATAVIVTAALLLTAGCARETPESLLKDAQAQIGEHDYKAAQITLRNVIRLDAKSGAAHRWLGLAFLYAGEFQAAEAALRRALELADARDDVVPALAQALLRRGQPLKVIDEFAGAQLERAAARAALSATLGAAYLARGNPDKGSAAFAAALQLEPTLAAARLGQARLAIIDRRPEQAMTIIDDVLTRNPKETEAHLLRARLLLLRGDRAAAAAALERAVLSDTADLTPRAELVMLRLADKQLDAAQDLLDKAPARQSAEPLIGYLRATVLLQRGDLPKAKEQIDGVLHKAPQHPPSLALAGEIDLRAGRVDAAETQLLKALRLQPAAAGVRRLLAAAYLRQGQPGRAVDVVQPLLSQHGQHAGTLKLAAEAYLASGDLGRAEELFEQAQDAGQSGMDGRLSQIALLRGDVDSAADALATASTPVDAQARQAELMLYALHMRRQQFEQAIGVAQRLSQRDVTSPLGPTLGGRARLAMADTSTARVLFDDALARQQGYVPALRGLAEADLIDGRPAQAIRRMEAAVTARGDDEALLAALADLHERTGTPDKAAELLRRAVRANVSSVGAQTALVQQLARSGDLPAALESARLAASQNPASLPILELHAVMQEAAGKREDALRSYREMTRLHARAPVPWLKLAAAQARFEDYPGAAQSLRQARQAVPDHVSIATDLVAVLLAGRKPDEAMTVAKDMQARHPRAAIGFHLEGDVHVWLQRWPDAERAYRQALGHEPASGTTGIGLCQMYRAAKRPREAASCVNNWLSRYPDDLTMREYAAESALALRDFSGAAKHYQFIAAKAPHSPLALVRYAGVLGRLRDSRSLELADRAVKLAPNDAQILDAAGSLHVDRGDPARGLDYLSRARRSSLNRRDIHLHYAMALARTGRIAEARREMQQLRDSAGDFPGKANIPALLARL